MSCYFRHLSEVFAKAGIELTSANRKEADRVIHQILGTEYKDCPATWKKIKAGILIDIEKRRDFAVKLRDAMSR